MGVGDRVQENRGVIMLAFIGRFEGEEWCIPIHGETRGKAKVNFLHHNPMVSDQSDFVFIRLGRFKALDDKPFTPENLNDSGWNYVDEDGQPLSNENFINDCQCLVCRGAK